MSEMQLAAPLPCWLAIADFACISWGGDIVGVQCAAFVCVGLVWPRVVARRRCAADTPAIRRHAWPCPCHACFCHALAGLPFLRQLCATQYSMLLTRLRPRGPSGTCVCRQNETESAGPATMADSSLPAWCSPGKTAPSSPTKASPSSGKPAARKKARAAADTGDRRSPSPDQYDTIGEVHLGNQVRSHCLAFDLSHALV